jgi:hypothetical protein
MSDIDCLCLEDSEALAYVAHVVDVAVVDADDQALHRRHIRLELRKAFEPLHDRAEALEHAAHQVVLLGLELIDALALFGHVVHDLVQVGVYRSSEFGKVSG